MDNLDPTLADGQHHLVLLPKESCFPCVATVRVRFIVSLFGFTVLKNQEVKFETNMAADGRVKNRHPPETRGNQPPQLNTGFGYSIALGVDDQKRFTSLGSFKERL